jgi:hypothetical protein
MYEFHDLLAFQVLTKVAFFFVAAADLFIRTFSIAINDFRYPCFFHAIIFLLGSAQLGLILTLLFYFHFCRFHSSDSQLPI